MQGNYISPMTDAPREKALVERFVELADTMVAGYDVVDFLHRLATCCAQTLGVASAGVLLPDANGALDVVASTSGGQRCGGGGEVVPPGGGSLESPSTRAPS